MVEGEITIKNNTDAFVNCNGVRASCTCVDFPFLQPGKRKFVLEPNEQVSLCYTIDLRGKDEMEQLVVFYVGARNSRVPVPVKGIR